MTTKTKKQEVEIAMPPEERFKHLASMAIRADVNAASVIQQYGNVYGEQDIQQLIKSLGETVVRVREDNMNDLEAMLITQAQALQSIFMNMARRAASQERMDHMESFTRMAMKAQNQCRMTLETLANIKNPPVVFARQANISHGHQQVNNGTPASPHAREEKTIQSNELLEAHDGKRLDTRTKGKTGDTDKAMAALEKINGAKNSQRKNQGST